MHSFYTQLQLPFLLTRVILAFLLIITFLCASPIFLGAILPDILPDLWGNFRVFLTGNIFEPRGGGRLFVGLTFVMVFTKAVK